MLSYSILEDPQMLNMRIQKDKQNQYVEAINWAWEQRHRTKTVDIHLASDLMLKRNDQNWNLKMETRKFQKWFGIATV